MRGATRILRRSTGWVASAALATALVLSTVAATGARPTWDQQPDRKSAPLPGLPEELLEVAFDQKLGDSLSLDLRFRDESGAEVPL